MVMSGAFKLPLNIK